MPQRRLNRALIEAAGIGEVVAGGRSTSRAPSKPVNASASGSTHGAADSPLTTGPPVRPTDCQMSLGLLQATC